MPSSTADRSAEPTRLPAVCFDPAEAELSQAEQDYLFELRGYRILRGALSEDQLARMNAFVDGQNLDALQPGQWVGNVEVHTYGSKDGVNFQNIMEAGGVFEELIDHPTWIELMHRYIGEGPHDVEIDENFLNVRESGGFIPIHSGGADPRLTSLFRHATGRWMVGQINVLMAMSDVNHGDGCTTVVPGSHKALLYHPEQGGAGSNDAWDRGVSGNEAVGMVEVHLEAGDALMFTDAITHGSVPRTNPGQRRVCIYRYSPHLMAKRMNFLPDPAWFYGLTKARQKLVCTSPPRMAPGRVLKAEDFKHVAVGG